MSEIPFIQAANFTPSGGRRITLLVIHSMEAPEKGDTAESVARYFHRPAVKASAHYCIDRDSIVQCVRDMDVAWAAPGANRNGLHFEHAGYARQTAEQWLDAYGQAMLALSAKLVAAKCKAYGIPAVWLTPLQIAAGQSGITSHGNITLGLKRGSHTDPGPGFPVAHYLALIHAEQAKLT